MLWELTRHWSIPITKADWMTTERPTTVPGYAEAFGNLVLRLNRQLTSTSTIKGLSFAIIFSPFLNFFSLLPSLCAHPLHAPNSLIGPQQLSCEASFESRPPPNTALPALVPVFHPYADCAVQLLHPPAIAAAAAQADS